ncbi:MAG: hypothetical protein HC799_14795 [Limnothrix sp. RL_2_0]|nr:hypothetical protein [Limnothrix sp. RL_2_0]
MGNSVFFALSGVGLALSKSNQQLSFGVWFWRRLTRIYPSLILVVLFFLILLDNHWNGSFLGLVKLAIWPTQFGFITQLLVFYIPYYFVAKLDRIRLRNLVGLLFIPFGVSYLYATGFAGIAGAGEYLHPLTITNWIFYFQMMVLGGLIAKEVKAQNPLLINMSRNSIACPLLAGTLLAYVVTKALIVLNFLRESYFLLNMLIIPVIVALFLFSMTSSIQTLLKNKAIGNTVNLISGLTLEIYLVHACLLSYPFAESFIFPLNIIVFVTVSLVGSLLVNWLAQKAQLRLRSLTA